MVMLVLRNMFSRARNVLCIFSGSIARSVKRRYLSYSEADFEVFASQGRHVARMGVNLARRHPCQISPSSVQRWGYRTTKTENFYWDL